MTVIAAYIMVDDRPRGERYSLLEALRQAIYETGYCQYEED